MNCPGFFFVAVNFLFSQVSNAFLFAQLHCIFAVFETEPNPRPGLCPDVARRRRGRNLGRTTNNRPRLRGGPARSHRQGLSRSSLRIDQQTIADNDMTRWLLKAIDVGASAVFMALCTKAICVQFYQDIKRQLRIGSSPSRTRAR